MKKKSIIIVASAVLAIALIVMGIIFAINNIGDCALTIGKQSALSGDEVKIPITMSKNSGLCMGQVVINYDTDTISFASCENGEVFDECLVNDNGGELVILVSERELKNTRKDGLLATVSFKIKDTAKKGEYKISFDTYGDDEEGTHFVPADVTDEDEPIVPKLTDGAITVK